MKKINKSFFQRGPEIVAKELLGKVLVRIIGAKEYKARIVETEAYYGKEDPSSWARFNGDSKKTMEMDAGTILVKMVHNNWLLNFVTGRKGEASAVLIRAIEPINFNKRTNGPGLLTKALKINKKFHKRNINNNLKLFLLSNFKDKFDITEGYRVGVTWDLEKPLRFFIKENKYVSKS